MSETILLNKISDLSETMGVSKIRHPLVEVANLSESEFSQADVNKRLLCNLYTITLKTKTCSPFQYGRKLCDFSKGTVFAIAPHQSLSVQYPHQKGDLEGYALYFHPDLLLGTELHGIERKYGFFSYDIDEVLHLSEAEQHSLLELFVRIDQELQRNIDDFSKDILISNIGLLLNYINRFFNRQFITRKHDNIEIVERAKRVISDHFNDSSHLNEKLPSVEQLAEKLHVSPGYLSDTFRKELGIGSQEFIHSCIIDRAKHALLHTNKSVSEIAYSLGFEYPQYFSRLFKQKTGLPPSAYRESHH